VKTYVSPPQALHEFHSGLYDVAILDNDANNEWYGFFQELNTSWLCYLLLLFCMDAIKIIFLTTTNGDNKEINTVTSNHFWIIRKLITINNLFEELIAILALEQNTPLL
jgi:hypothetical protein